MALATASCCCGSFTPPASRPSSSKLCLSLKGLSLQTQLQPALIRPLSSSTPTSPFVIVSQKDYKMKTHQAAAKRFRVTGSGKIICRRAGKQHLLWKKTTRRRKRLSKMALVEKADYQNITHALPYLKVAKG